MKPIRWLLYSLLAGALLAGCSRSPGDSLSPQSGNSAVANDEAEVSAAMAAAPELVEDGQYESADQTRVDDGSGGLAAIRPLSFFREIRNVETRFEIAFADTDSTGRPTTAIVTVHKHLRGSFNIVAGTRNEPGVRDTSRIVVRKPLADHWVRRLLLKRVPPPPTDVASITRPHPRWRVAATSGVEVTSRAATTNIRAIHIRTASMDTTIVDPLAFFRLRRVMKFEPGEEVRLTVATGRNDDVVVLVRAGLRSKFVNNGDNTYSLAWHAPLREGLHHVGVNALSNGTLFDDQLPYDSKAWIVPCVVSPTVLAEYMP